MSGVTGSTADVARLHLAAAGTSPGRARRFVVSQLKQWHLPQCEDSAELLVSELVTNALLHARTDMVVSLSRSNGSLLLEVSDESPAQPVTRRFSVHAGTGRGLTLVKSLAHDWGVRSGGRGKTVWVSLSTAATPEARDAFGEALFDIDSAEAL